MSNAQQAEALHRATMPTTSDINALVLEMRQAGTDSTYEIVKEAISRWAAPAAQAVEPVAMTEPDAAIREVIALVNQAVRIGQEAARHDFHIRPTDSVNSLKRLDSAMLTIETKMRALLAGASAPAQPTPEWEKVRRGLTMLMLGFAGRKDCSESAAEAALDAVTEPGMPLAGLRAQRAPAPAAVAVPQVDAIKQVLDLVDDWSQKDFAYAEAKLDAEATDATVTECAYADSCQEEAQKARQAIEAKLRDALAATPPAQAQEKSATYGMQITDRILHIGGRENAQGYIEFGSVAAVRALVLQVIRDLPGGAPGVAATQPARAQPYAVLVREIGESSFFDSKPIKPGSAQHLHAKSSPHYDYVELYEAAPQAQDGQRDDTALLDAMTANRIAVAPEFQGPWDAELYGEEGEPVACGSGNTPREAIRAAIAAHAAREAGSHG